MRRIRMLRNLQSARRRLRDLAAGDLASAEAERWSRVRRCDELEEEKGALLAAVPPRFLAASAPSVLLLVEQERHVADRRLLEAEQARAQAAREIEVRQKALARREADLRAADRLLEGALAELDEAVRRDEQRSLDDLTAARARRGA